MQGDADRLMAFIRTLEGSDQLVAWLIDSPGGNLVEAVKLADLINASQVGVMMLSGSQCVSACFLLFAAASHRVVAPDALIGVHSASENGQENNSTMGATTALAREAAKYGVPPAILGKMVQTEPNRVAWLTLEDLTSMDVKVVPELADPSPPEQQETAEPSEQPSSLPTPTETNQTNNWSSYGDWIQLYSRARLAEAVTLGESYKESFSDVRVFQYDNGWFALVVGPYPAGTGAPNRDRLVAAKAIPADSLVTPGNRFAKLVWGDTPAPAGAVTKELAAERVVNAAAEFFRVSTLSNRAALAFLASTYPPETMYFGRMVSREYALEEKRIFLERWPERSYAIRPGSISTACDTSENSCTVAGIVDWRVGSPQRRATASGSARFQLTFSAGGQLLSEWSEVLSRVNQAKQ